MKILPRSLTRGLATAATPVRPTPRFVWWNTHRSRQNKRTPLYAFHTEHDKLGKMVPFAGYDMPLNYEGKGPKVAGGPGKQLPRSRVPVSLILTSFDPSRGASQRQNRRWTIRRRSHGPIDVSFHSPPFPISILNLVLSQLHRSRRTRIPPQSTPRLAQLAHAAKITVGSRKVFLELERTPQ